MRGNFFVTILPTLKFSCQAAFTKPQVPLHKNSTIHIWIFDVPVHAITRWICWHALWRIHHYDVGVLFDQILSNGVENAGRRFQQKLEGSFSNEVNFCFASFHLALCWILFFCILVTKNVKLSAYSSTMKDDALFTICQLGSSSQVATRFW